MKIESLIIQNLLEDEAFLRATIPYLKPEYFQQPAHKTLFELISTFFEKYNSAPSPSAIEATLDDMDLVGPLYDQCNVALAESLQSDPVDRNWILDQTEQFCQDRAIYNAIHTSIKVLDDKVPGVQKGAIPSLLQDALAVSFDSSVGHDLLDDAEKRYDFYHTKEKRIPFDIEYLNNVTKGGFPSKTLNILMAGTNVGKSMAMCHMATHNLRSGYNVLYITLEMAEEKIAQRIDCNLLDLDMDDVVSVSRAEYIKRVEQVRKTTKGRLVIKEYPTTSAGSSHFRFLLNELKTKKNFVPDIIYIDYLNICSSSRMKMGNVNSYAYVKAIAEEIRGLAIEADVPVVTATQVNRQGFTNSDVGLDETSDSFGLPMAADWMVALIATEELTELGQMMVKQLKSRYDDVNRIKRFVVGVDKPKMRLYDVEQSGQRDIRDGPVADNTEFGRRLSAEENPWSKFDEFK